MIFAPTAQSNKNQGHLFVISGPSGVGKGILVSALLKALPEIALSVSATTRLPRLGEVDGTTYHFVDEAEFDDLIENDGLLEWAEVHGHRYGTLISEVRKALDCGKDLILEIDPQGDEQIKARMPEVFSIFIIPPSMQELRKRLEHRGTEDKASIEQRMAAAEVEMQAKDRYNVVVVNDDLDRAIQELLDIISKHRAGNTRA